MTTPQEVAAALFAAEKEGRLTTDPSGALTGFSGDKLLGALQRLAGLLDPLKCCYVEVGVFQGLTLLSVAIAQRGLRCIGIDNFEQFDRAGRNRSILESRREALHASNAHLVDRDYELAFETAREWLDGAQIGLYFVDGPHDYRSQRVCLDLVLPHLAADAVIVVDDCNYAHVRQANADFLRAHADFRLLFEAYTPSHPGNASPAEESLARAGWWNGVDVLMRLPGSPLERLSPPTESSRERFLNDHVVHASNLAEAAPSLLDLLQPVVGWPSPRSIGRALSAGMRVLAHARRARRERRFRALNTFSADLPAVRWHPGLGRDP